MTASKQNSFRKSRKMISFSRPLLLQEFISGRDCRESLSEEINIYKEDSEVRPTAWEKLDQMSSLEKAGTMMCSEETKTKRGAWKRLRPTEPPEKDTLKTVKLTNDCTVQVPRFYELPPMLGGLW